MRTEHDMLGTRSLSDDTLLRITDASCQRKFYYFLSYYKSFPDLRHGAGKKNGCLILQELHPEESQKMGCYPLRLRPDLSRGCG